MPKPRTLYDVLEVERSADAATLKTAYRRLARELHPDRTISDPPHIRAQKEKRFKEVGSAYTVLSDPDSRTRYDKGLADVAEAQARNPGVYGKRFDDFMDRMSKEGVNKGNVGDLLDDFFAVAREFKQDAEARAAAQKPGDQGSLLGLIEDLFGIEVKAGKKR